MTEILGHPLAELEALDEPVRCDRCKGTALPSWRLPWWTDPATGEPLWGWLCGPCVRREGLQPAVRGSRRIEPPGQETLF